MHAPVESLNVAVAAALILYEASRSAERAGHGLPSDGSFADDPGPPSRERGPSVDPSAPLAERMRPRTLDDIVGQETLLAPGRPLREAIEHDRLRSIISGGRPAPARRRSRA
jgi:hypothetical protein